MASNTDLESGNNVDEDEPLPEVSTSVPRSEKLLEHPVIQEEKTEVQFERETSVKFTLETHDEEEEEEEDEEEEEEEEEGTQVVDAQVEIGIKPTEIKAAHRPRLLHSQSEIAAPKKRFHLSSTSSSDTAIPSPNSLQHSESTKSRSQVSRTSDTNFTQLHKSQSEAIPGRLRLDSTSELVRNPARRTASARILSKYIPPPLSRPRANSEGPGCGRASAIDTDLPPAESALCRDHILRQSIKVKVDGPEYNLRYPRMDWWAEEDLPPRPKDFTVLSCMVLTCCNPVLGAVGCVYALKSEGAYKKGNYSDSIKFSRLSLYLSVFGIMLTLAVTITVLIVFWPDIPPRQ